MKLIDIEGLGDIRIGSTLEACKSVCCLRTCREHNNRDMVCFWILLYFLQQINTVHSWHNDIAHHKVVVLSQGSMKSVNTV